MDMISYYNSMVNCSKKSQLNTKNFLSGIELFFINIDFFYSLIKDIEKRGHVLMVLPSFRYDSNGDKPCHRFEEMRFLVEGLKEQDIVKLTEKLNNNASKIDCRFGKAAVVYRYSEKYGCIVAKLKRIKLIKTRKLGG